jgi:hypothetical protein
MRHLLISLGIFAGVAGLGHSVTNAVPTERKATPAMFFAPADYAGALALTSRAKAEALKSNLPAMLRHTLVESPAGTAHQWHHAVAAHGVNISTSLRIEPTADQAVVWRDRQLEQTERGFEQFGGRLVAVAGPRLPVDEARYFAVQRTDGSYAGNVFALQRGGHVLIVRTQNRDTLTSAAQIEAFLKEKAEALLQVVPPTDQT